jgi:hypothetical protein
MGNPNVTSRNWKQRVLWKLVTSFKKWLHHVNYCRICVESRWAKYRRRDWLDRHSEVICLDWHFLKALAFYIGEQLVTKCCENLVLWELVTGFKKWLYSVNPCTNSTSKYMYVSQRWKKRLHQVYLDCIGQTVGVDLSSLTLSLSMQNNIHYIH